MREMNLSVLKSKLMGVDGLYGDQLKARLEGGDWPKNAETMIGEKRLESFRYAIETVEGDGIEGDIIECGVWRGGAAVYAKAVLNSLNSLRKLYVADSFCGLPELSEMDNRIECSKVHDPLLSIQRSYVENVFKKYELLDDRVIFVEGWFSETLSKLSGPFAVIRMDGDLYSSTRDILVSLYPKLANGGYILVDDYDLFSGCKIAVHEYLSRHSLRPNFERVDFTEIRWRKT